ncbi:MAG: hypothetical protein EKK46_09410 [Rhodocyclaceae bacterium]|nr:MAG: hypothetical protein EKK46_09410 [Rhodocyclaceae bacterium]
MTIWLSVTGVIGFHFAYAGGMDSMLDGMFTQVTTPGIYQSQSRLGLIGGSVTMRVPNKSVNVLSFDPPRINSGCGGIDMFGGSFSFINAQEIVAVFRNIVQGAVAALFKMAINSISSILGSTMGEFSQALRELNAMFKNSCQIGESLMMPRSGTDPMGASNKAAEANKHFQAALNQVSDMLSGNIKGQADPTFGKNQKISDDPNVGNSTWRAMVRTQAMAKVATSAGSDPQLVAEMLMNIGGSRVITTSDNTTSTTCTGGYSNGLTSEVSTCLDAPASVPAHKLTFQMLYDPQDTDEIIGCSSGDISDEFSCQELTNRNMKTSFAGARSYVNQMLFGTADSTSYDPNNPGGLVGAILSGQSPDQATMIKLSAFRTPILRHLLIVQKDPRAAAEIANRLAPLLARDLAINIGDALVVAAKQTFAGKVNISKPDGYDQGIRDFAAEISKQRGTVAEDLKTELATADLVAAVSRNLPGAIPAPGGTPGKIK